MNKIYSQYNLERLRLSQSQSDSIKLERTDLKRGVGKNAIRKVFGIDESGKHEYDIYEKQQLDAFKKYLEDENEMQSDELSLRFLYANQFDFDQTIKHLHSHQQWVKNANNFKWTLNTEEIIKQGAIYISGRGQGYKPIIVVNADKLDISIYPIEDMMRAISIVFMVVKDYMLVSGKVESWFVIVEAKNTTAYKIPFNHLNQIFETLKQNFPCYLERIFILQPQTSIQITWQIVEQWNSYIMIILYYSITSNKNNQSFDTVAGLQMYMTIGLLILMNLMKSNICRSRKWKHKRLKMMPFTSVIDSEVSNLLRKQFKPKTKIYQEETHLNTAEYFANKTVSKTVLLNGPKTDRMNYNESQTSLNYQLQQKELNLSLEQNQRFMNHNNQLSTNFNAQSQQQPNGIPFQTRFVSSKTKINESMGSLLNAANHNPLFQSRFVGVKTQNIASNKDVSLILNKEEYVSNHHSQLM
ncbi:unnamed protein product (macronuclear) [Paramecium tetraurelia]|uniref:CRAL-TRIO domain-containing protein n=1 Tax=Paramecium tetraurelia TaxID=5888 RepID=A0C1K8_PARTE|nr:uncharacterized protein GSPATT00034152001 [Paramecium tetraurelia]CAK64675.1 unnamed protein product [Paramecium tetraurelia]|eukprot:XP_001432072.1 hypothetical protein (macronuclear) [Paramecium tetraurelia strain d4-2]